MRLFIYIFLIIILFSCKKENQKETTDLKSINIGNWNICNIGYSESFYNPNVDFQATIDTANKLFGVNGILKPTHQQHIVYINSNNFLHDSNSIFEFSVNKLPDDCYMFIYKSELVDISSINRLTISIHCEKLDSTILNDYDVSVLLRLCSDTSLNNNYYEIEKPLLTTTSTDSTLLEMWPNENFINVELNKLLDLKSERDSIALIYNWILNGVYVTNENNEKHRIFNNPNFANINRICIGLKNLGDSTSINNNDGLLKSIKIWIY